MRIDCLEVQIASRTLSLFVVSAKKFAYISSSKSGYSFSMAAAYQVLMYPLSHNHEQGIYFPEFDDIFVATTGSSIYGCYHAQGIVIYSKMNDSCLYKHKA